MNIDKLKTSVVKTLSTEDAVLLDLTTGFSVDEIADAYYKMMDHAKLMPDQNASTIASSILAVGMSVVVRSLAERKFLDKK